MFNELEEAGLGVLEIPPKKSGKINITNSPCQGFVQPIHLYCTSLLCVKSIMTSLYSNLWEEEQLGGRGGGV